MGDLGTNAEATAPTDPFADSDVETGLSTEIVYPHQTASACVPVGIC